MTYGASRECHDTFTIRRVKLDSKRWNFENGVDEAAHRTMLDEINRYPRHFLRGEGYTCLHGDLGSIENWLGQDPCFIWRPGILLDGLIR